MDEMMGMAPEAPMDPAMGADPMAGAGGGMDPLAGEMMQRELFMGEKAEQLDPYTISKIMEMLQGMMAQGQMPQGDMSGGLPPMPPAEEDPMAGMMPQDPAMADPMAGGEDPELMNQLMQRA